jgi:general secretion pathway protein J
MRASGFTLLEALVATAIMALMGMMTFGVIGHTLDSYQRATGISERTQEARMALERMAREISMAFLSYHHDCSGPRTLTLFKTRRTALGTRLDFTSFSHLQVRKDAKDSDQNELSYFVDVDPNASAKKHLYRREQDRIDEKPDEGGTQVAVTHNVAGLNFSFYNPRADRWTDDWSSSDRDTWYRLPKYVKITLELAHQPKEERLVTGTRLVLQEGFIIPGNGFAKCID